MNKAVEAILQPVNLTFVVLMLLLAIVDLATYFWRAGASHRNFKGEIVGLGILGTFLGIFLGLQEFTAADIQASIPPLLDGLKTAFLTSIAGMGISMALTVFQGFVQTKAALRADDPIQALLQDLLATVQTNGEGSAKHAEALLEQTRNARMEQRDESLKTRRTFEESFATMNASLEAALQKLSEGASKEIIRALEDVIRDFNRNLTEQFGENFKQLNAACLKLVEWQENYRTTIEQMEKTLGAAVQAIDETEASLAAIARRNEEFSQLCSRLGNAITTSDRQVEVLNAHLAKQEDLAMRVVALLGVAQGAVESGEKQLVAAMTRTDQRIGETQHRFTEAAGEITGGFQRIESEQRTQFAGIARTFAESCGATLNTLRETKQGLDEVSTKMQGSLSAQSQTLADLTKRTTDMTDKTRTELAEALRQLNSSLTSLTQQFGVRYRDFCDRVGELMRPGPSN